MKTSGIVKRYIHTQQRGSESEIIPLIDKINKQLIQLSSDEQKDIVNYLYINTQATLNKLLLYIYIQGQKPDVLDLNKHIEKLSSVHLLYQNNNLLNKYLDMTGIPVYLNSEYFLRDRRFMILKDVKFHPLVNFKAIDYINLYGFSTEAITLSAQLNFFDESSFRNAPLRKKLSFINKIKDIDNVTFSRLINNLLFPENIKKHLIENHMLYKTLGVPETISITPFNRQHVHLSTIDFE